MPDQSLWEDTLVEDAENSYRKDMLYKAILRLPEEEMRIIGMMLDEY
jgi:hypothetical protein